jgi:hypothetical protein
MFRLFWRTLSHAIIINDKINSNLKIINYNCIVYQCPHLSHCCILSMLYRKLLHSFNHYSNIKNNCICLCSIIYFKIINFIYNYNTLNNPLNLNNPIIIQLWYNLKMPYYLLIISNMILKLFIAIYCCEYLFFNFIP